MADILQIHLDTQAVQRQLKMLESQLRHTGPVMAAIAGLLESQTQQAFADQRQVGGSKDWASLAPSTTAQRTKGRGGKDPEPPSWPGRILNRSGGRGLIGSIFSASTNTTATVGAGSGKSAAYAAIHQFGGQAGRDRKTPIPARPYLPIRAAGSDFALTDKARDSILDLMLDMLEGR